ncbi:MAG: MATE family efflux transporter, partial [Planctomycetota bacterium]
GGNAAAVIWLDLGVAGIAGATILSRFVGTALALFLLKRGRVGLSLERRDGPLFDLALWRRMALLAAPVGARTMLFGIVYLVVTGITAHYGTAAQNGLAVGIRVEGICFFVLVGFGLAVGPIVGQNLGAGHPTRAARAAWITVVLALAPSLFFTALFLFAPFWFMSIFARDAATIAHGTAYLRIVAVSFVFLDLEVVLANAFVGAGDTLPPMLVDVPLTALRIPLALLTTDVLGWGPEGIWWTISGTAIARGIGMTLLFLRGRWKRARPDLDG